MSPSIIPMVIVPLTFLFVLLIILIVKAPKAGAWVIGGVLLLAPVFLWRFASTGALAHAEAIPLFVVPVTFLFVLLVILLAKAPRIGAGLIVALVVMVVFGLVAVLTISPRTVRVSTAPTAMWAPQNDSTGDSTTLTVIRDDQTVSLGLQEADSHPSTPRQSGKLSPIWSEGVEQELEADVYPSSLAAAKALGRRMAEPIRTAAGDPNATVKAILFQENNSRSLVAAFGRAMEQELPGVKYSIEADLRNIHPGEVGLTFRTSGMHQEIAVAEGAAVAIATSGDSTRIVATASTGERRASAEAEFVDKPWVESFGAFASERPDQSLVVARSNGACTSEGEAHNQALADAYSQVTGALGRHEGGGLAGQLPEAVLTTTDVLNGGFILDRFVQSFDTSAGKVWRQALLLDVSGSKLAQLARVKAARTHQVRESWAWLGFSAIGVLVLIGVIYFFLNMATRGYYEWSLRIAGVVLAVVAIVSILMIVQ